MNCVILAAGYATRLYPLTENFPKPLLKVGEKTILDWLVDDLDRFGKIERFVVVSNAKFADYLRTWKVQKASGEDGLIPSQAPIDILDDGSTSNETRVGAVNDLLFAIEEESLSGDLLVMAGACSISLGLPRVFEQVDGSAIGISSRTPRWLRNCAPRTRRRFPGPCDGRKAGGAEVELVRAALFTYRGMTAEDPRRQRRCGHDARQLGGVDLRASRSRDAHAGQPARRWQFGELCKIAAEYRGFQE